MMIAIKNNDVIIQMGVVYSTEVFIAIQYWRSVVAVIMVLIIKIIMTNVFLKYFSCMTLVIVVLQYLQYMFQNTVIKIKTEVMIISAAPPLASLKYNGARINNLLQIKFIIIFFTSFSVRLVSVNYFTHFLLIFPWIRLCFVFR